MNELAAILRHLNTSSAPSVLATLVTVSGSSYRRPGARLLLTHDRQRIGSISGGCLEEDVLARAARVFETGTPDLVTYDTTSENDLVWGVGLGCHGVVQVLIEKLPPRPAWAATAAANLAAHRPTALAVVYVSENPLHLGTYLAPLGATSVSESPNTPSTRIFLNTLPAPTALLIFGAGDDARPLVRLAKELGWHVTVADPRRDFATAERFPLADRLIIAPADELTARAATIPHALAVVMTHHYVHDVPILRDLLTSPDFRYIGLLGPKKRAERILADLRQSGATFQPDALARLHAPVGLDLGAETPEDVALSIVAEIRAFLSQRDARPLRDRTQPIHS
jgi:Xanthine and CO dehydrogenases maturation factor, XdhC/CoxF family